MKRKYLLIIPTLFGPAHIVTESILKVRKELQKFGKNPDYVLYKAKDGEIVKCDLRG